MAVNAETTNDKIIQERKKNLKRKVEETNNVEKGIQSDFFR